MAEWTRIEYRPDDPKGRFRLSNGEFVVRFDGRPRGWSRLNPKAWRRFRRQRARTLALLTRINGGS